ncbi:MAG TPA: sugar phosphate isomerase/epimerase family protein [Lacipirellulaceae bacterium]|nr:sugar phosphate isomerase/epimerase family protein [Lacipirellulaceae bacterium]
MLLAYNTNGLAHHDLLDAIELLAEIGYEGVAITLDRGALNPYDKSLDTRLDNVVSALKKYNLRCVVETGARYLLDLRKKHEPTLVTRDTAGRAKRVDFLTRAIKIAARLNADCVSLWSGIVQDRAGRPEAMARLTDGLAAVLDVAERHQMPLAFEPEPAMLIDTLDRYSELLQELAAKDVPDNWLRLTIDIGHLHCQGELPISEKIRQWQSRLANIHIEDMRTGVHEHLMFGDGEIDFPPVIAALAEIEYDGLLSVELSRHSHIGPEAARRAYNYLRPLLGSAAGA